MIASLLSIVCADIVFVGSGGCDGSDHACVKPASASLGQQIDAFEWDGASPLRLASNTSTGGVPTWVIARESPAGTSCVFATLSDIDRIASYERSGSTLTLRSKVPSGGAAPVFLDTAGGVLLAANYNGPDTGRNNNASVGSLLIGDDCSLTLADSLHVHGSGPDPSRQLSSHVHSVVVARPVSGASAVAFAADLGADAVYSLAVDLGSGKLELMATAQLKPGSGPRRACRSEGVARAGAAPAPDPRPRGLCAGTSR